MDNQLAQMLQPKMTPEELRAYIKKYGRLPPDQPQDQNTLTRVMKDLGSAWAGPKPYNYTMAVRG